MEENAPVVEAAVEQQVVEPVKQEVKPLKEQIKQQVRRFKLKINGSQRQVDEKTMLALAQKGGAADQKFQKSAAREKKIDSLIAMAKKDPDAFIRQVLGQDAVQFSKKRLSRQLEQLSLDPKQKELRDYKRKVQEYQAQKKSVLQAKQKQAQEKAVQHWTSHYDKVLPEAIKSAGLPLTQDVIRHATDIMIANLEQGFDLPMQAVMQLTRDRYLTSVKKFLGSADREKLQELLGQDVVAKLGMPRKAKPGTVKQAVQVGAKQTKRQLTERQAQQELDERIKKWSSQQ